MKKSQAYAIKDRHSRGQDKDQEKRFYDKMFTIVEDGHFIAYGYEEIYRKTIDNVSGGLALDVGCGTGKHTVNLAKKGFRTVAMDLSMKGILAAKEHAQKENSKAYFVVADVEQMPFKDEVFDVVFCALILHHFPDIENVSKEIGRVAKRYLFALEPNAFEPMTFLKFNVLNPLVKPSFMTPNQRALFPGKVETIFENRGFSRSDFSWVDIHVPYKGIVRIITNAYTRVMRFLPRKNKCNKFIMCCTKTNWKGNGSTISI